MLNGRAWLQIRPLPYRVTRMGSNRFGHLFTWMTFGESHGSHMGVIIDGCPSGVQFQEELLLHELSRRRPGKDGVSERQEADHPEILKRYF